MLECQSVRARDLSGANRRRVGRQKPGAAWATGGQVLSCETRDRARVLGIRERDQWSEDPGVGETCSNVYTADTAVTTET